MRLLAIRPAALFPLVTAAALLLPATAPAADPVAWRTDYTAARKEAVEKGLPLFVVVGTDDCFYCRKLEGGPLRDATVAGNSATTSSPEARREQRPQPREGAQGQLYPRSSSRGRTGRSTRSSRASSKPIASRTN